MCALLLLSLIQQYIHFQSGLSSSANYFLIYLLYIPLGLKALCNLFLSA